MTGTSLAQSVLNFTVQGSTALSVTNTTPLVIDAKFSLYNASDGSLVTSGVMNPVSRRIPARGQLLETAGQIFSASRSLGDTWIQVTSPISGLQGFSFLGDFSDTLEGLESGVPLTIQTIPYIPGDSAAVIITNPGADDANVTVTFYDSLGTSLTEGPFSVAAHVQKSIPGKGVFARVTSDTPVFAAAMDEFEGALIRISAQDPRNDSLRLTSPFFENTATRSTALILANSKNTDTRARVTFFDNSGGQSYAADVRVGANSSTWVSWQLLTQTPNPGPGQGWLHVDSDSPISGLVIVSSPGTLTAASLQSDPSDQILLSRFISASDYATQLSVVGNGELASEVTITLNGPDGTPLLQQSLMVPPLFRVSGNLRDLVNIPDSADGFLTIRSTAAVYALEFITLGSNSAETAVAPQKLPRGFSSGPPVAMPRILSVTAYQDSDGTRRLRIAAENIDPNATLLVGGQTVPMTPDSQEAGVYTATLPVSVEPGYVSVKIRSAGIDSNVWALGVLSNGIAYVQRQGRAFFQKVEVTETGLDLGRTTMVPIRNARVEIIDRATRQVLTVSETQADGTFVVPVPDRTGLAVQVMSRLRSIDIKVLDNNSGNRPYVISQDIADARDNELISLVDRSRLSGAFNVLDILQLANSTIGRADSQFVPPSVSIFWNERNDSASLARMTGGLTRTTFFNPVTGTAWVLGDRATDSDEFDDSVILHEYAHMLAARFSRDDSPGGPHVLGDLLDPRLAWSEGWADFFSSAIRGTPVYLDSQGTSIRVRYDLEENVPAGDRPGYRSEASVQGLLWDLFDDNADNGDSVQFSFGAIWRAFTDLRNDRFVYLPYFLEHFLARNPAFSDALRTMVILRNIDFQPGVRPSVVNPFPSAIAIGEFRTGQLDSLSSGRTNLANSAHFYAFSTASPVDVTISLSIESVGPANNPMANDLDIFLLDSNGRRLAASDFSGNGQSELIPAFHLTPGTYYVEVRSFYTRAETGTTVFNSGGYRLQVR